jgi:hypothetical protein
MSTFTMCPACGSDWCRGCDCVKQERDKYKAALQRIMHLLGPDGVPTDVDYTVPGNFAGLEEDIREVMRVLAEVGITHKRRRP